MLVSSSSILTTVISGLDFQAARQVSSTNRRGPERESQGIASERDMQLEQKHRCKSMTLRGVTRRGIMAIALATLAGVNAGCSSSAQPKAPALPEVSVAEVICKQVGDSDEFTGRLEAVNAVEVRPRVSGYLQSVHFREGAIVQQGDLLFQIDPRPFQAEVDRLNGDLSQANPQRSPTSRCPAPRLSHPDRASPHGASSVATGVRSRRDSGAGPSRREREPIRPREAPVKLGDKRSPTRSLTLQTRLSTVM